MKDPRDFWGEIRKWRREKTIHGNNFFKLLNSDIHDDHSVDPPTDGVNTA